MAEAYPYTDIHLCLGVTPLAVASGLVVISPTPAHADPILRNVYYMWNDCQWYGCYGIKPLALWESFTCEWVPSAGSPTGGYWFRYA